MALVFVYGTLKQSFPLFDEGLADASFLGPVQTVQSYPMLIAQDFFGPVMLDQPGEGRRVTGELYDVPDELLGKLDALESVGAPGSFRAEVDVEPVGGGLRQKAIGFMKDESWIAPAHTGYLSDYQDRRFVLPWLR